MKTLFLLILLLFSFCVAKAQSMLTLGTNNAVITTKGGSIIDSLFRLPIRGRAALYPIVPLMGRVQINRADSIPEWYNGKKWVKINDYLDLKHTPTIPTNNTQLTNGRNFISGITGAMVVAAMGFSPYSSANPSGYISTENDPTVPLFVKSITSTNINDWNGKQANLGFTPYNATNPAGYISTETDPTVSASVKSITSSNINDWNGKQANLGFTPYNATNPAGYISTETDPTVSASVKSITATNINDWNGKQANLGFTPYNATNPAGYISAETDPTVSAAAKAITPANITDWNNKISAITAGMIGTALGFNPISGIILSAGPGISITGGPTNFTISTLNPTINNNPTRALNTNYTASTSRMVLGLYTISCSTTNPLLIGNSTVTATYQYSTNGGTTWNNVVQSGMSSSVGVTVTLQLTTGQQGMLVVPIIPNSLSRITTTVSGTATVTMPMQAEITF